MPANSFWGGLIENLGPAIQQGQESSLKNQMMKMQMMEYEARQKKANAEAELAGQHQLLTQKWQAAQTPEEKQGIMQQGALLNQDYKTLAALSAGPAKSMVQQMEEYDAYLARKGQGGGMGGGGGGASPYGPRTGFNPTFDSDGSSKMVGYTNQPSGKQAEIEGLLHSVGADPNNKNAQIKAFSVVNAPPEVQSMLLSQFQQEFGGRQSQQQQQQFSVPQRYPQQPGQAPQQPQQEAGIEAVGPDGKPMYFDNQATYDEYTQRGLPLGPQGGAQQPTPQYAGGGGGGSPYDVVRQKETAAAVQQAGEAEHARTMNEGLSKEERQGVGISQQMSNLADDIETSWKPGYTGLESIGASVREKTGFMGKGEAKWRTLYNNFKRTDVRNSAGLSQTATELASAIDAAGQPGLSDQVFRERWGIVKSILKQGQEIDDQLLTAPRSQIPGILKRQRQNRPEYGRGEEGDTPESTRRVGAGGAGGLTPRAQDYMESWRR